MHPDLQAYYFSLDEPTKGCLLTLREFILRLDKNIEDAWKYRMPMFTYKGKMWCYLWTDKRTHQPYIGIVEGNKVEHPLLEKGSRARMSILRINPEEDLPIETIQLILNDALNLYKNGIIKIK